MIAFAPLPTDQIIAYGTTALTIVLLSVEKWKNTKKDNKTQEEAELVSDAKKFQERGDTMAKLADEWKERYQAEHTEFNTYRDYAHGKAAQDQAVVFKLNERVAELQAKPDYSDLFDHMKRQSDMTVAILSSIETLASSIKTLVQRHEP